MFAYWKRAVGWQGSSTNIGALTMQANYVLVRGVRGLLSLRCLLRSPIRHCDPGFGTQPPARACSPLN